METGAYKDISFSDYRAWEAFSISHGLEMLKSPGHYYHRLLNPLEATENMEFGTKVHGRILEPERFWDTYSVMPAFEVGLTDDKGKVYSNPKASNRYKELVRDWYASNPGVQAITASDATEIEKMFESILAKPVTSELLGGEGISELSLYLKDEFLPEKGRIDRWHNRCKLIVDLKTTDDASYSEFSRTIISRGYYIQQAHYYRLAQLAGLEPVGCVIVAVENKPPYGCAAFELDVELLEEGLRVRDRIVEKVKTCMKYESWPIYQETVQRVWIPEWLNDKNIKLLN